jgi:hypothetical protein
VVGKRSLLWVASDYRKRAFVTLASTILHDRCRVRRVKFLVLVAVRHIGVH